jgi:hypothetical protein
LCDSLIFFFFFGAGFYFLEFFSWDAAKQVVLDCTCVGDDSPPVGTENITNRL